MVDVRLVLLQNKDQQFPRDGRRRYLYCDMSLELRGLFHRNQTNSDFIVPVCKQQGVRILVPNTRKNNGGVSII